MCSSHCGTPTNLLITKQGKSIWVERKQKVLVFKSENPMIIAYNYDEAYVGILQEDGHHISIGPIPKINSLATWILYLDDISMKCDDDLKETILFFLLLHVFTVYISLCQYEW